MITNPMKYKNYVWKVNPRKIKISADRNIKEFDVPFNNNVLQDYGRKKRIVTGEGEFFGSNCMKQFYSLYSLFLEGGIGLLTVPGYAPFLAAFKQLDLIGESKPNVITYSFTFWEEITDTYNKPTTENKYYIASLRDSLWSIAQGNNLNIDDLVAINTDIKRPDQILNQGEKVLLP